MVLNNQSVKIKVLRVTLQRKVYTIEGRKFTGGYWKFKSKFFMNQSESLMLSRGFG